jgi:hypothetical protein
MNWGGIVTVAVHLNLAASSPASVGKFGLMTKIGHSFAKGFVPAKGMGSARLLRDSMWLLGSTMPQFYGLSAD